MNKNIEKTLRGFIIFGSFYFIFDGLLHFSNIKLSSTLNVWPPQAVSFAKLISYIYGSYVFLAAAFLSIIQKDLKKYRSLIILSSIWAFFHGSLLIFLVLSGNYQEIFKNLPSLLLWLPFYNQYLIFDALLLFSYVFFVYIWARSRE